MIKFNKRIISMLLAVLMIISVTACSQESPTATPETPEEKGIFTPGTYTGEADGLNGPIKVEVKVDANKILEVKVLEHKESPGISDNAMKNIPESIVEYQSLNIDTVSGATYSSNGILEAVKNALADSGANIDELMNEINVSSEPGETINKTADVVVIGGGGAGLAAAVSALQNNATVIVIEKMPSVGGSTIMAGGQYNAVDDVRQQAYEMRPELIAELETYTKQEPVNDTHKRIMEELATQIEEYKANGNTYVFDSPQLHALQAFKGGDQVGNLELIETFTKGAEVSIGWLESLGVEFRDEVATVTGALWQRTHQFVKPLVTGPIDAYMEFINAKGSDAEILLNTAATELIVENNKVVGVKAKQGNNEVIVKANNGVVIATGGFARNSEMVKKYDTHWGGLEKFGSTNSVSATGDGITLSEAVGANLVGMEFIQLLPVGDPITGGMQGNISINAANQLFVNNDGNRFVAEDARRDVLTQGLLKQSDQIMWILHDAHEYYNEEVRNDFNETIGQLVESGVVVKGETIEELAKNMGVSSENLRATVDAYNEAVAGNTADPMGKKLLQDTFDKGPFYASKRVPTIHHTMGGIEINTIAQVISKDGNIIKGLYAAGEVTGGIHGANRLGGNAIPDTVVFGKIAGESAALGK